ncbi:MAG: MlaD family protein [Solirubrobacterales bacterium]|jgi:phospholipid/cholesterol/gamma-HCH transport system substrate-binding protein
MRAGRVVALVALLVGAVAVVVLLFGGDSGTQYKLLLETGGQLVKGNQVLVGGQPIGTVDSLTLTDDGQAEVSITVDEPLHDGTTAVVRSTSLSGIANRYVSIAPGPNSNDEMPDGATLQPEDTTAPVDLDQLFNTLDDETRASLQKVINGSAVLYAGNTEEARSAYKYFAPALQSTERLLAEVNRDQQTFSEFLVDGADVLGAVAARRDDLSALTENANVALGAIAAENESLDRSLAALPGFLRQADTTFVNLRAALDDLDPLVETSKRATKDLPEFLADLRPLAQNAIPVVSDLRTAVAKPGADNDLTDLLQLLPQVEAKSNDAAREQIQAMDVSQDEVEHAVPYMPELLAFVARLGQVAGYYDFDGHYLRVMPGALGTFEYNTATEELDPIYNSPGQMFDFFTSTPNAHDPNGFLRCPGAASQAAQDGSAPFVPPSVTGDCDPTDLLIPGAAP